MLYTLVTQQSKQVQRKADRRSAWTPVVAGGTIRCVEVSMVRRQRADFSALLLLLLSAAWVQVRLNDPRAANAGP